jgi:hypothetical protein
VSAAVASPSAADARLDALVALIGRLDPGLGAATVRDALVATAPSLRARTALLARLGADPWLLTSGSPAATRPVSRLALALVDAGATAIVAPRCAGCHTTALLTKRTPHGGICDACYNRARTAACARCGRHRRIAGRAPGGEPLCSSCRARDPANHTPCSRCGRLAPVNARTERGEPLCGTCYRQPPARCDRCGRLAAINSRKGGEAVCRRCYRTPPRRCGRCGRISRIAVRARDGQPDLCHACHWAPSGRCSRCGEHAPGFGVRAGALVCLRCSAADRLDELLAGPDGQPMPALRALRDVFLDTQQPRSIHTWLDKSPARHVLRRIAGGELALTHQALDALPQSASLNHLRALLVACGALPERDPHLARLEHAIPEIVATLEHPDDRRLLRAYATWRILHRLRRATRGEAISPHAAKSAHARLTHMARFLRWLRHRAHGIEHATQAELDAWLATTARSRSVLGPFLAWAAERGSAPALTLPSRPDGSSPATVDVDDRWALARRLLHDDAIDVADRVAGAFAVIYAQPVARIARLSRGDVTVTAEGVLVRFGSDHVQMPRPLDDLVRRLPTRRQIGPSGTVASDWLFPGRQAGHHQHPEYLRRRLGALGIDCRAHRNAALLQLAAEVPAAVLADTIGIDPKTAVRWTKTAGGDWTRYAAQRARARHSAATGPHAGTNLGS